MMSTTYPTLTNTTNTVTTSSATTSSNNYHGGGGNLSASGGGAHGHGHGHGISGGSAGGTSFTSQLRGSLSGPSSTAINNESRFGGGTTTTSSNQQSPEQTTAATTTSSAPYYCHPFHPIGHSFLSDVNEVKDMENSLLTLLSSFHAGDLSAFGKGCSLQTMETIRAKQERLAKLHFELGSTKAGTDSSHQNWLSDDDQNKLVAELRELSLEIEKLHETKS